VLLRSRSVRPSRSPRRSWGLSRVSREPAKGSLVSSATVSGRAAAATSQSLRPYSGAASGSRSRRSGGSPAFSCRSRSSSLPGGAASIAPRPVSSTARRSVLASISSGAHALSDVTEYISGVRPSGPRTSGDAPNSTSTTAISSLQGLIKRVRPSASRASGSSPASSRARTISGFRVAPNNGAPELPRGSRLPTPACASRRVSSTSSS